MGIVDTIERILDVFELSESETERLQKIMLMSSVAVALRTVPVPDDFTVGETEEEFKKASEKAAEILENNTEARAAIAKHFIDVLESMGDSFPDEKLWATKKILEEFRK